MPNRRQEQAVPEPFQRCGFLLYRAGVHIAQIYAERIRPLDFSPVEVGVLTHVAEAGGNHARGIARTLGVSPQTVVNVTTGLEKRKLVRRSASEGDQRRVLITITEKGNQALRAVERVVSEFDQELLEEVGVAESAKLAPILQKVLGWNGSKRGRHGN